MAGKNSKRKAKSAKTGNQTLVMPKEKWQLVASAATMASAVGVSESTARICRQLAAKAEYYLGEPENKNGCVRGQMTVEEIKAYVELIQKSEERTSHGETLAKRTGGRIGRQAAIPLGRDDHVFPKEVCLGYFARE